MNASDLLLFLKISLLFMTSLYKTYFPVQFAFKWLKKFNFPETDGFTFQIHDSSMIHVHGSKFPLVDRLQRIFIIIES